MVADTSEKGMSSVEWIRDLASKSEVELHV